MACDLLHLRAATILFQGIGVISEHWTNARLRKTQDDNNAEAEQAKQSPALQLHGRTMTRLSASG